MTMMYWDRYERIDGIVGSFVVGSRSIGTRPT